MISRNYEFHTHTYRCKHAYSDFREYVLVALKQGITHLGFSDHCPYPNNRWEKVRMYWNELPIYIEKFLEIKEEFKDDIHLYLGLECEYIPKENDFIQKSLLEHYDFDFFSFGGHYTPYQGKWIDSFNDMKSSEIGQAYFKYLSEGATKGHFNFITHPDLYGEQGMEEDEAFYTELEKFLAICEEHGTILEINARGLCKAEKRNLKKPRYPQFSFWERVSKRNISVIVNSDAHHPNEVGYKIDQCLDWVEKLDLNMATVKDILKI